MVGQISDESLLFISSSFNAFKSTTNDTYLGWNKAPKIVIDGGGEVETLERTYKVITVILLGWLGGYDSRGIHAVNFLVELRDLLCLDPISILDWRIVELENGLATWGSDKEEDDCERCFIFQTFRNTDLSNSKAQNKAWTINFQKATGCISINFRKAFPRTILKQTDYRHQSYDTSPGVL
ncbi:hypothetical protein V6N11_063312 [Hibiscus sabdariffa]|uniref:Uncharacterized protein n=1 Tax=Hibiscus sabdariffa TaxID=183260 RepID=A0ABR2NGZ5_9ROSI